MATTTEIEFKKEGSGWICQLADYQAKMGGVISLALSGANQIVTVEATVEGMPPMVAQNLSTPYGSGLIFEIDFPAGVSVTLRTAKEVTKATWIQ